MKPAPRPDGLPCAPPAVPMPERRREAHPMKDVYCRTLMELAEADHRVVALDADLMNSMGMVPFRERFPDRTFNCGIQEANMIGVAAGLSAAGKIPFAHSFATFATRRCFDQIFLSAAYARLNVRIVGSDPGVTAAPNGGTHMPLEDLALMRTVPGATVLEPVDSVMLADLLRQVKDPFGVFYIRLLRKNAVGIYPPGTRFTLGRAVTLRPGNDATLLATGVMVAEALAAADTLAARGVSARVVNVFTLKPMDRECVVRCAEETGALVTVENHNIVGGLGSAVAEVLAEARPVPLVRVGVRDRFGEVGTAEELMDRFEMSAPHIVRRTLEVLERKSGSPPA